MLEIIIIIQLTFCNINSVCDYHYLWFIFDSDFKHSNFEMILAQSLFKFDQRVTLKFLFAELSEILKPVQAMYKNARITY